MPGFLSPLTLEYIDGHTWRVTQEFSYHVGAFDGPDFVRIPAGELTDFASVPRVLWPLLPPTGSYGKAAVVHDYLYRTRRVDSIGGSRYINRSKADRIFREAMEVLHVSRMTRWMMYLGVRTGGHVMERVS